MADFLIFYVKTGAASRIRFNVKGQEKNKAREKL